MSEEKCFKHDWSSWDQDRACPGCYKELEMRVRGLEKGKTFVIDEDSALHIEIFRNELNKQLNEHVASAKDRDSIKKALLEALGLWKEGQTPPNHPGTQPETDSSG